MENKDNDINSKKLNEALFKASKEILEKYREEIIKRTKEILKESNG